MSSAAKQISPRSLRRTSNSNKAGELEKLRQQVKSERNSLDLLRQEHESRLATDATHSNDYAATLRQKQAELHAAKKSFDDNVAQLQAYKETCRLDAIEANKMKEATEQKQRELEERGQALKQQLEQGTFENNLPVKAGKKRRVVATEESKDESKGDDVEMVANPVASAVNDESVAAQQQPSDQRVLPESPKPSDQLVFPESPDMSELIVEQEDDILFEGRDGVWDVDEQKDPLEEEKE